MLFAQIQRTPGIDPGATLVAALIGLVIAVAIGTLVGAIVLRAACWLYNKMAGGADSPTAVPEPNFGKAMLISFVTMLVNFGIGLALGIFVGVSKMSPVATNAISLPISFVAAAGMISAMLPTSFGRGLLVALLYLLVCIVIVVIVALIFGVLGAALFFAR